MNKIFGEAVISWAKARHGSPIKAKSIFMFLIIFGLSLDSKLKLLKSDAK
tara:strand:+ start:552 stop:701 length:150 start_codon:yes stop_codon:yes gene_type:complete